jgi:hypothetical protein
MKDQTCQCGKIASKQCSRCKKEFYCSTQCQKSDWATHKKKCQPWKEEKKKPNLNTKR